MIKNRKLVEFAEALLILTGGLMGASALSYGLKLGDWVDKTPFVSGLFGVAAMVYLIDRLPVKRG